MNKFFARAALALLVSTGTSVAAVAVVPATTEAVGADAAACRAGAPGPALLVHVHGFEDAAGNLRVQLYSDVAADFLAKGKKLRRIEVPMASAGPATVCIELPGPGKFAVVVLHDRNSDGKTSIWSDGYGFSNNPRIRMGQPNLSEVLFAAGSGVGSIDVVLNYFSGGSIRPLAGR